jgi:hypothetical protein
MLRRAKGRGRHVNAVFDLVSFGLTRRLLRLGATHAGFVAVAELLGAAVLFVLLGVALVSYVHRLNEIGAPVVPGSAWWSG